MTPNNPASPTEDRLSTRTKISFGVGNLSVLIGKLAPKQLALPVYNDALGVNSGAISSILGLIVVVAAFTDTLMGHWSDNTMTRWGRRRPFILCGTILTALFFTLMWMFPRGLSSWGYTLYFAVTASLFYLSLTMFSVPWYALGYELPSNYDERTRLQSFVNVFGFVGQIAVAWCYPITQLKIFGDMINGVRFMGCAAGAVLLIFGLIPALFVKEPHRSGNAGTGASKPARKHSFVEGVRAASQCAPFVRLAISFTLVLVGISFFNSLGFYVHTYYLFGGDRAAASILSGWNLTIICISSILLTPLASKLSILHGKKEIFLVALCWGAARFALLWFLLSPTHPWLALVNSVLAGFDMAAIFMLCHAMISDICDEDELGSGQRREGLFGALYGWIYKNGNAVSLMIAGYLLVFIGFKSGTGKATSKQTPEALMMLKVAYCFLPFLLYGISALIMRGYGIDRARAEKTREELLLRNGPRS